MTDRAEILRRLALGDQAFLDAAVAARRTTPGTGVLDHAGASLVRIGALAATDGSDLTWRRTIGAALDAGVMPDEIVDALVVLAPLIGATRAIAIAPKVALALDIDVDAALEALA